MKALPLLLTRHGLAYFTLVLIWRTFYLKYSQFAHRPRLPFLSPCGIFGEEKRKKKIKPVEDERWGDQESNAETRRKPEESQERERNGDEGGEMQTIGLGNIMEGEKEERRERGKVLL